jgi:diketogulonate reductase-like aldo/keto reductase
VKESLQMKTKPFGRTGVPVPIIGQGTWKMGDARRGGAREAAALSRGLELGMTHIDTAEMYGNGAAEEMIAGVLRQRRRNELFLASKVVPENASYRGTIAAAERSLRRLGTDYLDLYLLHWPGRHPIAETMRAMEDLVAAGKIRFLGVSNFDLEEMRDAMQALTRERLACNQVLYNLATRGIELDLIPFCEREGIAVVGYTPFGSWPGARSVGSRVLETVAARHGATARQVALRFLTRLPSLFAIPKASEEPHVRDNAGAGDLELSRLDIDEIDAAFPAPRRRGKLSTA